MALTPPQPDPPRFRQFAAVCWNGTDPRCISIPDSFHPRMARIYRVDQGRHLPAIAVHPPSPEICRGWGGVGLQDRWRHGWRHRAPMDGFTACPACPHRPAQQTEKPEPAVAPALALAPPLALVPPLAPVPDPFGGPTPVQPLQRSRLPALAQLLRGFRIVLPRSPQDPGPRRILELWAARGTWFLSQQPRESSGLGMEGHSFVPGSLRRR